jgi:hypothetical protein|tara:strand:- start:335 stop:595 length:261 start_codon:yes stop_codon:yes gene_type:complete
MGKKQAKAKKPKKINLDHLDKLQAVVNEINKAQMQIGIFQTNIHSLLHHVAGKSDELNFMKTELEKEYGTDDINIVDGTINYNEDN